MARQKGRWSTHTARMIRPEEFDERFPGPDPGLAPEVWTTSYLPAWSSRTAAAAALHPRGRRTAPHDPARPPAVVPRPAPQPAARLGCAIRQPLGPARQHAGPAAVPRGAPRARGAAHRARLHAPVRAHRGHLLRAHLPRVDVLGLDGRPRGRAGPLPVTATPSTGGPTASSSSSTTGARASARRRPTTRCSSSSGSSTSRSAARPATRPSPSSSCTACTEPGDTALVSSSVRVPAVPESRSRSRQARCTAMLRS